MNDVTSIAQVAGHECAVVAQNQEITELNSRLNLSSWCSQVCCGSVA